MRRITGFMLKEVLQFSICPRGSFVIIIITLYFYAQNGITHQLQRELSWCRYAIWKYDLIR
jgi:hypothetical protein